MRVRTESHEGLSDLLQRSPFAAAADDSHGVTPCPWFLRRVTPRPRASALILATSSATVRLASTVVLSRNEPTTADSKMRNWTTVPAKMLRLWPLLRPHTRGTISLRSFDDLRLGFVLHPRRGCACGIAFRSTASSLLCLFVQRVGQIAAYLRGSTFLPRSFYDNSLRRHTFQQWSCGPLVEPALNAFWLAVSASRLGS